MSIEVQYRSWARLRYTIEHSLASIVKNPATGFEDAVAELLHINIVRGAGIFANTLIRTVQSLVVVPGNERAALITLDRLASAVAVVNSQFPQTGRRVVETVILATRGVGSSYYLSLDFFVTRLVVQKVVHGLVVFESIQAKLLEQKEQVATSLLESCRTSLTETSPQSVEHLDSQILGPTPALSMRFQASQLPVIENEATHVIELDDNITPLEEDFFADPAWEEKEHEYSMLRAIIFGTSELTRIGDSSPTDDKRPASFALPEGYHTDVGATTAASKNANLTVDMTNQPLIDLRKRIYLAIMSTMSATEAAHKLLRLPAARESAHEIVNMLIESCAQERTYNKIYGNVCRILSQVSARWQRLEESAFEAYYEKVHEFDTNQIRNIGSLFGSWFAGDAISWSCLAVVRVTPSESTPSNRILLQCMFEEMRVELGFADLRRRLEDPKLQTQVEGLFHHEDPAELRFAINYFTAINMGPLTEGMRAALTSAPSV